MTAKTVKINGRIYQVRPDADAAEIKRMAGIDPGRVLVARRDDGALQVAADDRPLPGTQALDAPRFIYG